MVLQNILIADDSSQIYMRGGVVSDGAIVLPKGESVSFDTYFNSFCYTKYRDHTIVSDVGFDLKCSGNVTVQLCVFDGEERVICSDRCNGATMPALSVRLSELPQNGIVYARITALEDSVIISGAYTSECNSASISVCIAICTFRREQYVVANIERLRSFDFSFIDRVFVVDNGNTLDAAMLADDFVSVVPNRNYGGSGGFTRGLIEAHDGGYTHVILMDDDVVFHPQTLEQMTVFMSLLTDECKDSWFSAAMLPISETAPYMQYEMGASWDGRKIINYKTGVDVRDKSALIDNLDNDEVRYGAWWCLCMPVSVVCEQGLPYPFFIKYDDVEYGIRMSGKAKVITSNGIAVYHEAFDKKLSMFLEYYMLRNQIVLDMLYGYSVFTALRIFLYEAGKNLVLYRYDNVPIVLRAIKDVLCGVDFFLGCDEEKLNSELIAAAPQLVSLTEIPQWDESLRCDSHIPDKRINAASLLTLGGHLIPSFLLDKKMSAVPLSRCGIKECFAKKEVIQYQLEGDKGIMTRRSFGKFLKYGFLTVGMAFRLLFRYAIVRKQVVLRKNEITSFEFWRKHLGM